MTDHSFSYFVKRDRLRSEQQSTRNDDQARRLVENDGFERRKSEYPDQHREAELGTAETDESAEDADHKPR